MKENFQIVIKKEEYDKYLNQGKDFINDQLIEKLLTRKIIPSSSRVREIIAKAESINTLSLEETADLIAVKDEQLWAEIEDAAARIKKKVYDNRIVTFAPLYLSNFCVNNCAYCGFRQENNLVQRKILSLEELKREVKILAGKIGHKRLIVVYGEHPKADIDYMTKTISEIYRVKEKTRHGWAEIRRVNVNAPPLSVAKLKKLKQVGIGTYQVFQETYNRNAYRKVHPENTIKGNFHWRLYSMHRALEAGIDDVGIGVLFGLYDWRFEILGLVSHALNLEKLFGVGPHTISFPRLEPAVNTPFIEQSPYRVSDDEFRKIIVILRLAVPYTGMIITAREPAWLRDNLIPLGCTQTDASSKIGIGAYQQESLEQEPDKQQFVLGDTRSLEELIRDLAKQGYITSFCTAGYRCGRTGEKIMDLLRSGVEGKFCKLNAILTFREWLDDFASEQTIAIGEKLIQEELNQVKQAMPEVYPKLIEYYNKTKEGLRDLYF